MEKILSVKYQQGPQIVLNTNAVNCSSAVITKLQGKSETYLRTSPGGEIKLVTHCKEIVGIRVDLQKK